MLGHIGATKLYHFLKRLYYFQGMKRKLNQYVRYCHKCQIMNLQKPNFIDLHHDIARIPQHQVSNNFLGPYNITSQGNSYSLTAVCNLIGYCNHPNQRQKKTMTEINHLFLEIMLKFGFPRIFHSPNGTEFKSKLMENLSQ